MADENMSFLDKFNAPLDVLWAKYRVFFVIFGVLILIIKFRSVIIDLLLNDSRKIVKDTQNQDVKLKSEEKLANDQANELVKEADELEKNKSKIDEDWYKK